MDWFWFESPEPRAAVIADLEHGLFQSKHSNTSAMDAHASPFIIDEVHCSRTKGAFWSLFPLLMAHDLINHRILQYSVHKLTLVCYLCVNPGLHIDINRPSSDCFLPNHTPAISPFLIVL